MNFLTFLLVLSCAMVQIQGAPLHVPECGAICTDRLLQLFPQLYDNCQIGCRYFYGLINPLKPNLNSTLKECHWACDTNFSENEENKQCLMGCDAVYINLQHELKHMSLTTSLGRLENQTENFTKVNENHVIPATSAPAKTNEENYQLNYYDEFARVQYISAVQLSIFCFVLFAALVCCWKVFMLFYQFKLAIITHQLNTSPESKLLRATNRRRQYNGALIVK